MPYKRRYTMLQRIHDNTHLIIQAVLVALLIAATSVVYAPKEKPDAALNDAVLSCQARGYFDVGTVRVQCQVAE